MSLPPRPWSERMRNAAEVRSAYLEAEVNISDKIDAAKPGTEGQLLKDLRAARLQSDAAEAQMWIIHKEEQAQ